jgi:hypothetical protein
MNFNHCEIVPPCTAAENVGREAISLARKILRRDPRTAAALEVHPELAGLAASAMVMLGGRVLKDLLSTCGSDEIGAHLRAVVHEEEEGYVIDIDGKVVTNRS